MVGCQTLCSLALQTRGRRPPSPLPQACILLGQFVAAEGVTTSPPFAGYALTFADRGTAIASATLSPDVFLGATGITQTMWLRYDGPIGPPFGFAAYSAQTSTRTYFCGFEWDAAGYPVWHMLDLSSDLAEVPQLHRDMFRRWRHLAFSWSAVNGSLLIYVDGELTFTSTICPSGPGSYEGYGSYGVYESSESLSDGAVSYGGAGSSDDAPCANLTAETFDGVRLAFGAYMYGPTTFSPTSGFRGSLDHVQLWTDALNAQQIRADYETLGTAPLVPIPVLRYTFDEGLGTTAINTGSATGFDVSLGWNPGGVRFFLPAGRPTTWQHTAPFWSTSDIPLNSSAVQGSAPMVRIYTPGQPIKIALPASTPNVRISAIPPHGKLFFEDTQLTVGSEMPSGSAITYVSPLNMSVRASFGFDTVSTSEEINVIVHLIPRSPPHAVLQPPSCNWPFGILQCDVPQLQVHVQEDTPTIAFLIGGSPHGEVVTAVIVNSPKRGSLYQVVQCCDPIVGRGAIIRDGDQVLDDSGAVIYVPTLNDYGENARATVSFYVRDPTGVASDVATMVFDVHGQEDPPLAQAAAKNPTQPLEPIFVPLYTSDGEGDEVTLALAQAPSHGNLFLSADFSGADQPMAVFAGGGVEASQIFAQHPIDVHAVSSFWPGGADYHPLQIIGEQGKHTETHTNLCTHVWTNLSHMHQSRMCLHPADVVITLVCCDQIRWCMETHH